MAAQAPPTQAPAGAPAGKPVAAPIVPQAGEQAGTYNADTLRSASFGSDRPVTDIFAAPAAVSPVASPGQAALPPSSGAAAGARPGAAPIDKNPAHHKYVPSRLNCNGQWADMNQSVRGIRSRWSIILYGCNSCGALPADLLRPHVPNV